MQQREHPKDDKLNLYLQAPEAVEVEEKKQKTLLETIRMAPIQKFEEIEQQF